MRALGPLRLETDDGTPLAVLRPMERRLLAALTARRPRVVTVDSLADALWPEGPPASARKTIQTNVLRVRTAVGADVVETVEGGYRLADDVEVDVDRFEAAMRAEKWEDALDLMAGTPFADVPCWVPAEAPRARLEELRCVAEEARLRAIVDSGEADAVADLEALVAASPLRESSWCLLVRALDRSGRRAEALRAYERARETLIAELGVSPGPELAALYEGLIDDREDVRRRAEEALAASGDGWVTGMDASDPTIALLEDAAARIGPGPTPMRARLLARLAVVRSHHRSMADGEATASSALATARILEQPEVLAEALHACAVVVADPGRRRERQRWIGELLQLAERHRQPVWRRWALPLAAREAVMDGEIDAGVVMLREANESEAALLVASVRGDWAEARAVTARIRAEDEIRLFDPNAAQLREFGILGILALHEGTAVAGPRPRIEWPLPSLAWATASWHADALARSGKEGAARAELEEVDLDALGESEHDGYWLPTMAMFADAAYVARCPRVADAIAGFVEPHVGLTIFDPGLLYRGTVSHAAGLAAATCGRTSQAEDLLGDALATHERQGSPWMAARSADALAAIRGA